MSVWAVAAMCLRLELDADLPPLSSFADSTKKPLVPARAQTPIERELTPEVMRHRKAELWTETYRPTCAAQVRASQMVLLTSGM